MTEETKIDSVEYWNDFYKYKEATIPHEPSSFARRYHLTILEFYIILIYQLVFSLF